MSSAEIKFPVLATAHAGPLSPLEQTLLDHQPSIEAWLQQQWLQTPAPVYGSVDLRNAGFKLAPVDMNLYPAGFNNLSHALLPLAADAARNLIKQRYPGCQSIVLVPENHSRNIFYWESLSILLDILRNAGFTVRVGADANFFVETHTIELSSGKKISVEPLKRVANRVMLTDFDPCLIWLNNDLSSGIPAYLHAIEQPICPPMELGWHQRLKSIHFGHYRQVIAEFAQTIAIDPWLLDPLFRYCGDIDFMQRTGEACLVTNIEQLLCEIQKKYDHYHITAQPFVIVKADAGTYGMGVMSVKSADDIRHLNRKQRTSMSASKGRRAIQRVIIQEGVHSIETLGQAQSVAEPVLYMMGTSVIGGFYRLHKNKNNSESLNAPGMEFANFSFAEPDHTRQQSLLPNQSLQRFYTYNVVARLSLLAAAREQQEVLHAP